MNIFDLDNIKIIEEKFDKELGQTKFWDLTETTYQSRNDISYSFYYVEDTDEMRIDLICNNIYGTTEFVDIILNFNEISNPLNIKSGDILKYPARDNIELLRYRKESKDLTKSLLNRNKSPRKDDSRKKYIGDDFSLPPTVLPSPTEAVVQEGDNAVIGGGLFNS